MLGKSHDIQFLDVLVSLYKLEGEAIGSGGTVTSTGPDNLLNFLMCNGGVNVIHLFW